jgi:hypothetical protein
MARVGRLRWRREGVSKREVYEIEEEKAFFMASLVGVACLLNYQQLDILVHI